MLYDLVIFDLDGTLLDTLDDLKNAVNCALAEQGFSPRTREEIRTFIGNGVQKLIARAMPETANAQDIARAVARFKEIYNANLDVETKPYPGIYPMLERLKAAGVKVGINSNKYDAAVKSLCVRHFPGLYEIAVGESSNTPKKPDPAGARAILAATCAEPSRTLYIGDSTVDLETAKNAGLQAAWVSWGFRTRQEMGDLISIPTFDSAEAVASYILS